MFTKLSESLVQHAKTVIISYCENGFEKTIQLGAENTIFPKNDTCVFFFNFKLSVLCTHSFSAIFPETVLEIFVTTTY